MSTRQLRLNSLDQIIKKFQDFKDKKINIVLVDNTALIATARGMGQADLDVVNMRLKKIKIPLNQIYEIYYDTKE